MLLSWIEPADADGTHAVRAAHWNGATWSSPKTLAESDQFFVNWADFPSVVQTESGARVAHWLARGSEGGYDYGVEMAGWGGDAEGDPWWLHEDRSPSEHGFVTVTPLDGDELGAVWLDGRDFPGSDAPEMQLRFRRVGPEGPRGEQVLLDGRTCECCQTDAVRAGEGLVVVYRNRTEDEIRDIAIVREREDGSWSDPAIVHDDEWEINACPVNGPAVDARGANVVVAWFTGAQDTPRVQVAFSSDGGVSFGPPTRIDSGSPVGRVDVVTIEGGALVSWVEETGADGASEIRLRVVSRDGELRDPVVVANTTAARRSGFPQMVPWGASLVFAWHDTEASRVRAATLPLADLR